MASGIAKKYKVDWNQFRNIYHSLSFKRLESICNNIDILYPVQRQHHAVHFCRMIKTLPDDLEVVELGCHEGHLAKRMLEATDKIKWWVGYDFESPIKRNVCMDKRYSTVSLDNWFHKTDIPKCDVFVASHVLEHLSSVQLQQTLTSIDAKHFLFEIPLKEEGRTWNNGACTHVLEWGLIRFCEFLKDNNFKIFKYVPYLGIIGATKENHVRLTKD
jgi:hypothetical protein